MIGTLILIMKKPYLLLVVAVNLIFLVVVCFLLSKYLFGTHQNQVLSCDTVYTFEAGVPLLDSEELEVFESQAECYHWSVFMVAAMSFFAEPETKDRGVFYYYIGQLRASVGLEAEAINFETLSPDNAEFDIIMGNSSTYEYVQYYVLSEIAAYAELNEHVFTKQRKAAAVWDEEYPYTQNVHQITSPVSKSEWNSIYGEIRSVNSEYYEEIIDVYINGQHDFARSTCLFAGALMDSLAPSYNQACQQFDVQFRLDYYEETTGSEVVCVDSIDHYAVACPYEDRYYCVDSTGFIDSTDKLLREGSYCVR